MVNYRCKLAYVCVTVEKNSGHATRDLLQHNPRETSTKTYNLSFGAGANLHARYISISSETLLRVNWCQFNTEATGFRSKSELDPN